VIKQAAIIRERVALSEAIAMCKRMQIVVSTYYPDEEDVIEVLARRGEDDLCLDIARLVMTKFGAPETTCKDPRFDKTKRALAKKLPKGPRGGNAVEA
jgi:hypothetical protein